MSIKVNDLVKIVKQPANQTVDLVGKVGLVTHLDGDFVSVAAITLDGRPDGTGSVHESCLESVTDDTWKAAGKAYQITFDLVMEAAKNFEVEFADKINEIAEKYDMDPFDVEEIFAELDKFCQDGLHRLDMAAQSKSPPKDLLN